jgi:hypothetical protein
LMMGVEEWRREYEQTRYLREVDDAALRQRYDDLAANLWSTDATGSVKPTRNPEARQDILRLLLHTILEQMERTGTHACDFDEQKNQRGISRSLHSASPKVSAL